MMLLMAAALKDHGANIVMCCDLYKLTCIDMMLTTILGETKVQAKPKLVMICLRLSCAWVGKLVLLLNANII